MPACPARYRTARPQERPVDAHRLPGVRPPGQEILSSRPVGVKVVRATEQIVVDAGNIRPFPRKTWFPGRSAHQDRPRPDRPVIPQPGQEPSPRFALAPARHVTGGSAGQGVMAVTS